MARLHWFPIGLADKLGLKMSETNIGLNRLG